MKLETTILNYTGHDIVYVKENGKSITFPSEGLARLPSQEFKTIFIGDVSVVIYNETEVDGLPPEKEGVMYIVSSVVHANMNRLRKDLLMPCRFEKDENNKVIACRAFKL